MNFEKREVTRTADATEQADLVKRLLEVLSSIDQTKEEAKAAASEYNGIIKDLHKREIGLRFNLQTATVTQEIEVHAMANEATGMMEYFNREGVEVTELRHPMSEKQKEQEALQRQLDMFGSPQELADNLQSEMQKQFGDDVTVSVNGFQASDIAEFEKQVGDTLNTSPAGTPLGDIADLVAVLGVKNPSDDQPVSENEVVTEDEIVETISSQLHQQTEPTTEADTDEQPDIRDGINGAIAILTGNDKPLPKNGKKRKSESETV